MPDKHIERGGHNEPSRERSNRGDSGPISDREVPLAPVATSDVINRWLDGELPEPSDLRGESARSVEFWRRIGEETERRRHMMTPAHIPAKIMAALPAAETSRAATSTFKKPLQISPVTAIAAAVGIFALGMLVMNALALR
ncbi:MAG: hypothetical protein U0132_23295 [Gemmatimonadaceae bacterium]